MAGDRAGRTRVGRQVGPEAVRVDGRDRGKVGGAIAVVAAALSLALTLLLLASPVAAQPQPPYWQRFDVSIDLQQNGDFLVTEDQTVLFGPTTARRGFREIPLDRVVQITDVSVSEPGRDYRRGAEAPYSYQVTREGDLLRIDWWFPPTSNAPRTFLVSYRVVGGLRYYPGGDQLFWKAIYADRPYPIESARVAVRFPAELSADQIKTAAYPEELGVSGSLADPRTVQFAAQNLPAGTGLEVRVQFPHGLVAGEPPPWQAAADRADWYNETLRPVVNFFLGVLALLVLVVGSLWVFASWYGRGRDPGVGELPRVLSEPPGDLPPAVAGTLVDQRADVQDAVATLIDLARRGVLRIVEESRPRAGRTGRDFRLELLQKQPEGLHDYEQTIVDALFAEGSTARFSKMGRRFREAIPAVQWQLYNRVVREGFFPESPEAVRGRHLVLGSILLVGGAALAILLGMLLGEFAELVWAPFAALALVGVAKLVAAPRMPARTPEGALAAARWEAFARYLSEQQPREELQSHQELFEPYLPYAVAFGVDRQWVRMFAAGGAPAPRWYEVERGPVHYPWWGWGWGVPGRPGRPEGVPRETPSGEMAEGLPSLQELSDRGAWNLQDLSDNLAGMLNQASEVMARGGRGGWGGGGGGWSGGGGGGGG
ncbi:MAG: DUF2207 family protein, partial [Chloroflexota bacterium]